uniref:Uncharacterized protein n=1 Tax=Helianthus annuus TaxID=4232 RepID=A0A251UKV7_HELAN
MIWLGLVDQLGTSTVTVKYRANQGEFTTFEHASQWLGTVSGYPMGGISLWVVRYVGTGTCWLEGVSGHGCIDGFIYQTFIYYGCLESIYIMLR